MGVFDQLINEISQSQQSSAGASSPGLAGSLMSFLGNDSQGGGLANLVDRFKGARLGHVIESWISNRPNQPVNPDQLRDVLGEQQTKQMAAQSGLSVQTLLSQLAQHLPQLIDRMTPDGTLPPSENSGARTIET